MDDVIEPIFSINIFAMFRVYMLLLHVLFVELMYIIISCKVIILPFYQSYSNFKAIVNGNIYLILTSYLVIYCFTFPFKSRHAFVIIKLKNINFDDHLEKKFKLSAF